MEFKQLAFWHILLALIGIGLAFGYHLFYAPGGRNRRRIFTTVLIVCAASSFYFYLQLGPQFYNVRPEQIMNTHDFFHYYMGPKYFDEVGFFDLYDCAVIADAATNQRLPSHWLVRDLRTYRFRTARRVINDPGHCLQLFSKERWRSFKDDVAFLTSLTGQKRWGNILRDKGYNATPIWTAFASVPTKLIPLRSTAGLYGLLSFDYLYTIAAFVAVGLAFGWRHSLFVVAFWSLNFMTAHGFIRGSISRLDWLACLVIVFCLLRRGRYAAAGALGGLATGLRVFPVLFFAALASKAAWSVIRTRRVPRRYLRFLVGFVVTLGLLVGMTSLTEQGRSRWQEFTVKITGHDEQLAGYRVGLKYALIDPEAANKQADYESKQTIRWVMIALALLIVFLAAPRMEDHHTLALSLVCLVFLTAPTFYYYQMLVVPFMAFLPDPRRPALSIGAGAFFGWCAVCWALGSWLPLGIGLSHRLSWSLIVLCALIVALVGAFRPPEPSGPRPA